MRGEEEKENEKKEEEEERLAEGSDLLAQEHPYCTHTVSCERTLTGCLTSRVLKKEDSVEQEEEVSHGKRLVGRRAQHAGGQIPCIHVTCMHYGERDFEHCDHASVRRCPVGVGI